MRSVPLLAVLLVPLAAAERVAPIPLVSAAARGHGRAGGEGCQVIMDIAWAGDGRRALMATNVGGIWCSDDAGATWTPGNLGLKARGGSEVAFDPADPQRAFLVASNGGGAWSWHGLHRSLDAGRTWSALPLVGAVGCSQDGRGGYGASSLAFDRGSIVGGVTRRLWWSTPSTKTTAARKGLWRSEDGGDSWTLVNPSLADHLLVCDGRGALWAGGVSGLWRIAAGGDPGQPVRVVTADITSLAWSPAAPDRIVYCAGTTLRIRDVVGGAETAPACVGMPATGGTWKQLRISPADPQRMILSLDTGVFYRQPRRVTSDGGATWVQPTLDTTDYFMPHNDRQLNAAWHPTDPLQMLDGYDHIARSTDGGRSFRYANDGYNGVLIGAPFEFHPTEPDLLILSAQDYNGAVSTDRGRTWTYFDPRRNGWGGHAYGAVAIDRNTLAVGSADGWNGTREVRVSRDGGASWSIVAGASWVGVADPDRWGGDHALVDPRGAEVAFLGPYRTADGGATWARMDGCKAVMTWNRADPRELFGCAGAAGTAIAVSTDRGATWRELLPTSPSGETVADLAYDHVRGLLYVAAGESRVHVWNRGTAAWTTLTARFPLDHNNQRRGNTVAVDPADPAIVYVGSRGNFYRTDVALLRSLDAGATWTNLTLQPGQSGIDGLNEVLCVRVHPVTREVFVTTSCMGVWRLAPPNRAPGLSRAAAAAPMRMVLP